MTIKYVKIPIELYRLNITSLVEMSLMSLIVSFGDKGLRMSNANLAISLNADRRNVIRAIARLKEKGYIEDTGSDTYHRKLVLGNSGDLSLLGSGANGTKLVANVYQTSGGTATHKVRKKGNKDGFAVSSSPSAKPVCDEDLARFGCHMATPEEIAALEAEGLL